MDIYVARQPIFNRKQKVIGYELLYRSGLTNSYGNADGTEASLSVIRNTFLFMGQRIVPRPSQAFVNLTGDLLLSGVAGALPSSSTVLEILEDVEPDEAILEKCRELKETGYTLALDDYTVHNKMQQPLLELADIVKVDFMQSSQEESRAVARELGGGHKKLVAEKVETLDDFRSALAMGYTFFQGYFFSKPVIVPGTAIPGYKLNYMRLLREMNKRHLDFHSLEGVIKQDPTLCYTLLKYINSAYFGLREKITSLVSAMVLLGEQEVRRWASLVLFSLMAADKPPEVILRSLIRARLCEALAADGGLQGHQSELFLMGMFSLIDVLVGRPLADILEELYLTKEVKGALLGEENAYGILYALVVAYERGEWSTCFQSAAKLGVNPAVIPERYIKAVTWAEEIVRGQEPD